VQSGHEKVVEALLGMGAAVQLTAGKNGETPLHTASRIENGIKCVEMLIKSGAQINAVEDVKLILIINHICVEVKHNIIVWHRMARLHCISPLDRDSSKRLNCCSKTKQTLPFKTIPGKTHYTYR